MSETYKAILRGDKIEWEISAPAALEDKKPVPVYITIIENNGSDELPDGKKMAESLRKISSKGGISTIENASQWQRDQRHERNLTGRDE